jgi:hypothetical protein
MSVYQITDCDGFFWTKCFLTGMFDWIEHVAGNNYPFLKENLVCHFSSMKNGRDISDLLSLGKRKSKKNHLISSICSIGPENEKNS